MEGELSEVMRSFSSLDVLTGFRKTFMKAINRPLNKAILWPFLQRDLLGPRMDEIFAVTEELLQAGGPALLSAFRKANESLEGYASEAERHGTHYSREYLSGLAKRIHELVRKRSRILNRQAGNVDG